MSESSGLGSEFIVRLAMLRGVFSTSWSCRDNGLGGNCENFAEPN